MILGMALSNGMSDQVFKTFLKFSDAVEKFLSLLVDSSKHLSGDKRKMIAMKNSLLQVFADRLKARGCNVL